jgi:glycosyltransferase involved in cell wall biosynthesis
MEVRGGEVARGLRPALRLNPRSIDLVSVIVPAFNAERYLATCLASLLDQDYPHLEIVCVDDASTDATPRVLRDWAARDPRVVVRSNAANRGRGASCNAAVAQATGRFVAFVDADDYVDRHYIGRLVDAACSTGTRLVSARFTAVADDGHVTRPRRPTGSYRALTWSRDEHLGEYLGQRLGGWRHAVLAERRFLLEHDLRYREGVRYAEDFPFQLEAWWRAGSVGLVADPLYYYRQSAGSLTARFADEAGDLDDLVAGLKGGRAVLVREGGRHWLSAYEDYCRIRIVHAVRMLVRHQAGLTHADVIAAERRMTVALGLAPLTAARLFLDVPGIGPRRAMSYMVARRSPGLARALYLRGRTRPAAT